jgi:pimeloyl-ACP methyl ester carboxylesterase
VARRLVLASHRRTPASGPRIACWRRTCYSLGRDQTPPGAVSLASWTEQIAALAQSEAEPIVLVGHSRGGIVLSEVAERIPERIRALVYVTAFLLEDSCCAAGYRRAGYLNPSCLPQSMVADDHQSATIRESAMREAFYGQCSDEDVVLAQSLLRPEPLAPLATPVHVTARFGSVARIYVECTQDRAITHAAQRRMQAALPCRERVTLDADHSPFFCRAEELAAVLLRL